MTSEQKAAFINAQTALMMIEKEIMTAENLEREKQGLSHANGPRQWRDLYDKYEPIIGYNGCIWFFSQ